MESDLSALISARHHDPHRVLGLHDDQDGNTHLCLYQPHACKVQGFDLDGEPFTLEEHAHYPGIFHISLPRDWVNPHPCYQITTHDGHQYQIIDPYSFLPTVGELDLHLFAEGKHLKLWNMLGAQVLNIDGITGVRFAVWAPNAKRVSVVGDFNNWDGRRHPMRVLGSSGVWELFIPGMAVGDLYKFEILNAHWQIELRTDPVGRAFEMRPNTAAIVPTFTTYDWNDSQWLDRRSYAQWQHQPMSIYEVHLGSWMRDEHGGFLNYRTLAEKLVDYVLERGFTHIELLPVTEHPFDGSWGYQTTGYFAPTSRYGDLHDFCYFVDYAHQHNIGVILDWVPAHFPKDRFALAQFDGTALYEHQDPRQGEHRDWGTLIFNYGRNEVRNFLIASAQYWIEQLHIDGLRVDAVAAMLYLDYSREPGDWIPNQHGGRENIEAIDFLRQLNHTILSRNPGVLMIAEESTAWPMVSRPPDHGGLGFSMKWNMGWMNDSLSYMAEDPINRSYHHNLLTFGMIYQYAENFVLPLSHDEVVHGKGSMPNKMPGDEWQRYANLRLLYTWQFAYPGKKLLFMGTEFGQGYEWNYARELDWWMLDYPYHSGIRNLVDQLNRLYQREAALHALEFEPEGFAWLSCDDREQSVVSFLRYGQNEQVIALFNFTPVTREHYRFGVPENSRYQVLLNTDATDYAGSGQTPDIKLLPNTPLHGQPHSIELTLPGLTALLLKPVSGT
ncbi:MAG TPA: 1,4-alpha-glucan branching protein GlgB [Halothiobacillaceae bacterium]|nr:1,4-alpha-glucan branching protein GlgB [Halothiobacillaceae bacterium]